MSLIAEFLLESPILREALSRVPESTAYVEDVQTSDSGGIRLFFWMEEADFEAFAAGVEADPTVRNLTELVEVGERRLFRVEYTAAGRDASAYPAVVDVGAMNLDLRGTHDGWELRMRFPDRDALHAYRSRVLSLGIGLGLRAVYSEGGELPGDAFGLTEPQREVLTRAFAEGYFAVPREITLGELANQLGVSTQAASVRLRRAHETLIGNSIAPDGL
ncbi:helix-turn-helix domain-containing protein [Halegenticoccus soli]|uniref:helix-turn-helix domain-containing protein n=1 Tax=Halegenticoccus soli TaxID=1985678 RepID=UPI000C6E64BB|nr:helix-turn-helix domain-containing protein [Halegenticoccus soli]